MILLFSIAAMLAQDSTTTCNNVGGTVQCTTRATPSVPPVDYSVAVPKPVPLPSPAIAPEASTQSAAERRAAAYAQVGKMIAEGRCGDAKRLAKFYGKSDIIADTERACAK